MLRGKCRGADPQIFDGEPLYDETAKAYCARCDVRTECLEYAFDPANKVVGVWGGLNDAERRAAKRGGSRRTCPGCRSASLYSDGYSEICLACGISWKS